MSLFTQKQKTDAATQTSPSPRPREALQRVNLALGRAHKTANDAQAAIDRLRGLIAAAGPAKAAVQRAVRADGGKALEGFASNGGREGIGKIVHAAQAATRAADAADAATPDAVDALRGANIEIGRLEKEKEECVKAVLLLEGAALATRYLNLFNELGAAHDALVGFARGSKIPDIQLTDQLFEAPRFGIGCMLSVALPENLKKGFSHAGMSYVEGETWSPFLKHSGDSDEIFRQRNVWLRFGRALQLDHNATLGGLPGPDEEIEIDAAKRGLLRHPERQRSDAALSVNQVLYGARG